MDTSTQYSYPQSTLTRSQSTTSPNPTTLYNETTAQLDETGCSEDCAQPNHAWQLVSLLLVLLGSICANGVVFIVFRRKPSLLTISNRFVLNLSTCNILLTAWVVPMSLSSLVAGGWPLGMSGCTFSAVITMFLLIASIYSVLLISLDRYYAIVRPLHYTTLITSRIVAISLSVVWTGSCVVALPPAFGIGHVTYDNSSFTCNILWTSRNSADKAYVYFVCLTCFMLPFLIMLYIYVKAFCTAVRNSSRLRRNSAPHPLNALQTVLPSGLVALVTIPSAQDAIGGSTSTVDRRRSSSMSLLTSSQHLTMTRRRSSVSLRGLLTQYRDDIHAAKTALLVVSTFALCWLPVFVLIIFIQTTPSNDTPKVPRWMRFFVVWLTQLSSFINPLVYVFRSRPVFSECRKMLTCARSPVHRRPSRNGLCSSLHLSSIPNLHYPCSTLGSIPNLHYPSSIVTLRRPTSAHTFSGRLSLGEMQRSTGISFSYGLDLGDCTIKTNDNHSDETTSILKTNSEGTIRGGDALLSTPTKGVTFRIGSDEEETSEKSLRINC